MILKDLSPGRNMGSKILLFFLLITPTVVLGRKKDSKYFTAAVFEHRPRAVDQGGRQEIAQNLKFYEKAVSLAAVKGADIILFNEFGLFGYKKREHMRNLMEPVPDPEKSIVNPCNAKMEGLMILPTLSCLAKKHNIYVVANMGDIQPCGKSKCPQDKVLMYNTDVVFDRQGNLVARYHKMHPYFEDLNIPEKDEYITFKTEFGTFGLVVNFDSVFDSSLRLAKYHNIDTLLFPTFWFDDIVPLNGVEWQQSWAIANDVNVMAANTQTPGNGSLGSGIYTSEKGALVYSYEPDGESKLLIANVPIGKSSRAPINPSVTVVKLDSVTPKVETGDAFPYRGYYPDVGKEQDHYLDYRYFKHQTENYTLVKLEKAKGNLQACNNKFCCKLSYAAKDMGENYYFGAFSGLNNAGGYYHWCEETCLLLRCEPLKGKPCVLQTPRSNTVFKSLKITAEFSSQVVYPTVSENKQRLAPKSEWKFTKKAHHATLSYKNKSKEPLLKAALLGRCYDRDPEFIPWFIY